VYFDTSAAHSSQIKAKFHYAIQLANQLASWSQTCSRPI